MVAGRLYRFESPRGEARRGELETGWKRAAAAAAAAAAGKENRREGARVEEPPTARKVSFLVFSKYARANSGRCCAARNESDAFSVLIKCRLNVGAINKRDKFG